MKNKEHVKIDVNADFLENGDIDFEGQVSGSLKNIVTLVGVFIGQQLKDAPEGTDKRVIALLAKGMALGRFGGTTGTYTKTKIPEREKIIELLKGGKDHE